MSLWPSIYRPRSQVCLSSVGSCSPGRIFASWWTRETRRPSRPRSQPQRPPIWRVRLEGHHDPATIDTAPREEEKPLLLYCPEHGGWRIGALFEGNWLDFFDLITHLTPTTGRRSRLTRRAHDPRSHRQAEDRVPSFHRPSANSSPTVPINPINKSEGQSRSSGPDAGRRFSNI